MGISSIGNGGGDYQQVFRREGSDVGHKNDDLNQMNDLNRSDNINSEKRVEKEIHEEIKEVKKEDKKAQLQELTKRLNEEMQPLNTSIKFGFDDKVEELYVNVIDKNTDKVIRKIPSDEALKLMAKMREIVGALFDEKG